MDCSTPGFPVHHQLLKLPQIHVIKLVMSSNHLILCHPLLLLSSNFPSSRFFRNESVLCIRWPKHWNFSFRNSLSNEYSGLISFRMVWLALLAVQGIFKNLLQQPQFKSINSSLLSFLYSPTLNPYMTTEKKHSFDKTDL